MAIDIIEHKYIDPNLYSGSLDAFRTALGRWFYDAQSGSALGEYIDFVLGETTDKKNDTFAWNSNINLKVEPALSGSILPNYKFPVRIMAEPTRFEDDIDWARYVMGGPGSEQNYPGIFQPSSYDDFCYTYKIPYSNVVSKYITNVTDDQGGRNPYRFKYAYNYYLRAYQNKAQLAETMTSLPNVHLVDLAVNENTNNFSTPAWSSDSEFVESSVSFMGEVGGDFLEDLFEAQYTQYMPPHEDVEYKSGDGFIDKSQNIREYLGTYFAQNVISQSVATVIDKRLQNIIFDYSASAENTLLFNMDTNTDVSARLNQWPYYIHLEYPKFEYYESGEKTEIRDSLIEHGYTARFVKLLKEAFLNEHSRLRTEQMVFSDLKSEYSAQRTVDGGVQTTESTIATDVSFRYIDFMQFMQVAYNNYRSETNNWFIMRGPDIESAAADDALGVYRFYNTVAASKVINDIYNYVDGNSEYNITSLDDLFKKAETSKYREVVAYRIEKSSLATTNSAAEKQNIWFFNNPSTNDPSSNDVVQYFDSQVKYGAPYTYKIYAYVIVIGHKYQYSDLRLSRTISDDLDESGTRCLEFYDPFTGDAQEQLFQLWEDNPLSGSAAPGSLGQFTDNSHVLASGDDAHTTLQDYGYLADFYLTYEPAIRLIEIPLGTKAVTVIDNPGPAWEVAPFYFFDNTDRLGFELIMEAEQESPLPPPLGPAATALLEAYRTSNDLIPGEKITVDSKSRITGIHVFRTNRLPGSYTDLATKYYTTLNLIIGGSDYTATRTNFVDSVQPGGEYYYLFVGVNELNVQTHVSPLYRAQLVDDSGYKYANFEVVTSAILGGSPRDLVGTSSSFRNFFGLKVNPRHTTPRPESVDLEQTAESQVNSLLLGEASELIWDRKFKIRLTSKKTGKKIDLNLSYKAESE